MVLAGRLAYLLIRKGILYLENMLLLNLLVGHFLERVHLLDVMVACGLVRIFGAIRIALLAAPTIYHLEIMCFWDGMLM